MKSFGPIFGFLIFACLCGFYIWIIEIPAARVLVRQHRAESFPMVRGVVISGKVVVVHGSKGRVSYRPSFWYEYQVGEQTYTGRRYRYDAGPSFSESAPANSIVNAHSVGSEIDVYYNPADPHDGVLSPRVEGLDVGMPLVGLALCLFMAYGALRAARQINFPSQTAPTAGGVKIISEKMTIRVRLPRYSPLSWGLLTVCILSLISGIAVNLAKDAALETGEITMLFIVVAGAAVYFWLHRKTSSGSQDLVIDEASRTVRLPLTYKRREVIECAFSEITGLHLVKVAHRGRYGTTYTYAPTLLIAGKPLQRLTDLRKERAESFAAWLREKLQLPEKAGELLVEE